MRIAERRSGTWTPGLSADERETVFLIARDTLAWCVKDHMPPFAFTRYALTGPLLATVATFVTLHRHHMLRGCIGSLEPVAPLYRSVHDNTVAAARHDPRFPPVLESEIPLLTVDVSILGPVTPIPCPDEFRIGEHGIIIEKGWHRAVYLPEVAPEQGWTREETLESLSAKAGLPPDAWREGASFKVFPSVVLSAD